MSHETMEVLRLRLAAVKGRWPDIADLARIPVKTVRQVAQGVTENPRISTVEKIIKALDEYALGRHSQ